MSSSFIPGQPQHTVGQASYSPRGYTGGHPTAHFYQQHYGHSIPANYSPAFTTGSLPTTMTTLAQENTYEYPTSASNSPYAWSQSNRSLPNEITSDLTSGFATPYRTNTYPTVGRRMTVPVQQTLPTSVGMMPSGLESHHMGSQHAFNEHSAFDTMQVGLQQDWSRSASESGQPGAAAGQIPYAQGWYPQVADLGQAENQPQMLPSQGQASRGRQHKPG
jgi:hypothetical protein